MSDNVTRAEVMDAIKAGLHTKGSIHAKFHAMLDALDAPEKPYPKYFKCTIGQAFVRFDNEIDCTFVGSNGFEVPESRNHLPWWRDNREELTAAAAHALLDKPRIWDHSFSISDDVCDECGIGSDKHGDKGQPRPELKMMQNNRAAASCGNTHHMGVHPWRESCEQGTKCIPVAKLGARMMQASHEWSRHPDHHKLHEHRTSCDVNPKCIPVAPPSLGEPELGDTVGTPIGHVPKVFLAPFHVSRAISDGAGFIELQDSRGCSLGVSREVVTVTAKAVLRVADVLIERESPFDLDRLESQRAISHYSGEPLWYKAWRLIHRGPEA